MGLILQMRRGAARFRADVADGASGAPSPWSDFWYGPIGSSSASGMRVNPTTALQVSAALACVLVIARNIAMMPVKIYRQKADGGRQASTNHPVYDLLASQPNAQQSAFEFYQMMQAHVELRGNAYALIQSGPRGAVDQLIPLHPDRMQVERLSNGRLRYRYSNPYTNQTEVYLQEEIFHLRNFSLDGILGTSTIGLAADVYGTALAQQDYAARFFENDARPGGVLEGAKFQSQADEDEFRASWQRSQTGANKHKTAILPPGVTYREIGVNPADAQLLEARKFSRVEICSLFGVPPHLIGETEKAATYASVEQFNIMFVTQCLLPRVTMWEQAIQRDLILSPNYFPKFSMAALLRGDTAARFAAYQVAIQNGWLSQNDVRAFEDLNPIEGGDQYWRPLNWAPLTQAANQQPALADDAGAISESGPDDAAALDAASKLHQLAA